MPRIKHDDPDMTYACPGCDVAGSICKRVRSGIDWEYDYRCNKCGHEFDEPNEREKKPLIENLQPSDKPPEAPPNRDEDGIPTSIDPSIRERILELRGKV